MTDQLLSPEELTESPESMISSYHDLDYGGHLVDEVSAEQLVSTTRRRLVLGLAVGGLAGYGVFRYTKSAISSDPLKSELAGASTAVEDAAGPVLSVGDTMEVEQPLPVADPELLTPAPFDQRVLVLIELEGGNDGQSTVVPYQAGAFHDLRGNLVPEVGAVHAFDDEVGLHPNLGQLAQRQMAIVEGVGPVDGVLSHFVMAERWGMGNMAGEGGVRAGFLARLADAVDTGAAVTGLSVAGYTPRFNQSDAAVLSLERPNQLNYLTKSDWIYPAYRRSVGAIGGGPMASRLTNSWNQIFSIGRSMGAVSSADDSESPMVKEGGDLGRQLLMAATAIKANIGVRVVHARLSGFDTHDGHKGRHDRLMGMLDAAVGGFLSRMDDAGLADRVLVATSSEFGRRGKANGGGLDHGSASNMLLFGPVSPGRYGEPSPLGDLDRQGNFKTTIPFDRYLATLAQDWLGVDAASVLANGPEGLGLFVPAG